ncbi:MAG TPA: trehalase family glycosidase [Terrimicrobiaceae bacterium]|nr:trehalase family glycosidase [Terrimicrobiaceae bacterium]
MSDLTSKREGAAAETAGTWDPGRIPEPVFDAQPGWIKLYWRAQELAYAHVKSVPGLPQNPYMDEGFDPGALWIWDTCFMSLFCRYAPEVFPGIESLNNFYACIHDGVDLPVKIQHPDNPPLFAWVEEQYFQITGDTSRLKWLLEDNCYLQKHFHWFRSLARGATFPWARAVVGLQPHEAGFQWNGVASGMDNSPRFDPGDQIFAIDALAQQGLSARCISRLAAEINNGSLAAEYRQHFESIRDRVNRCYWDELDGIYYDLLPDGKTPSRVKTPASFWPLLAGMATPRQAARMAEHVKNPECLGGEVPWCTVERSSPGFDASTGGYWRGAVWLPTAYLGIRALSENGHGELADQTAEAVLAHMARTFACFHPQTIWECYHPVRPEPSVNRRGKQVRPDFCGWSALGPISLLLEHVLGFHSISAVERRVKWRLHQRGRHGIRRLRFGKILTDILTDGNESAEVCSSHPYTLEINGTDYAIRPGQQTLALRPGLVRDAGVHVA